MAKSSKTKSLLKGLLLLFLIAAVALRGLWSIHLQIKGEVPLIDAARDAALKEGREEIAQLGDYPTSVKRGELTENQTSRRKGRLQGIKTAIIWAQEFEAPGVPLDMIRWYENKLSSKGWGVWDPTNPSELQSEWCKPHWLLTIEHNVKFEHPPSHRFRLQLEWMWNFASERCLILDNSSH